MNAATVISGLRFEPLLPPLWFAIVAVLALLPVLWALFRRARGAWWRAAAAALLLLALADPRLAQETRAGLSDIALVLVDESLSQSVGARRQQAADARAAIEAELGSEADLELRFGSIPEGGGHGTQLAAALRRSLAEIPRGRLAGVVVITDGQVHDLPDAETVRELTGGAPLHALLTGRRGETDRRIRLVEGGGYGIVNRPLPITIAVEDLPGGTAGTPVQVTERRDGGPPRRITVPQGRPFRFEVPVERAGESVLELEVETLAGEVSTLNNRLAVQINGVRDRLRVLLVSGEPNPGLRTWRRLLKADPSVDLVHFTILRPPEKDDMTPLTELALIAFPVRELFQERIKDFDLIIFDRFANRGILPPAYLRNVADYVRRGGALLVTGGPEFGVPGGLASSPLGQVMPVAQAGRVVENPYRAAVTDTGHRHPVTERLPGANTETVGTAARWGRWYRRIDAQVARGQVLMTDAAGAPLLVVDRVGEGRVALLLTDQLWLWSRNHDGGGPQAELLRRIAHWSMKEPELEEEDLRARMENGQLMVERRSLAEGALPELEVTDPTGAMARHRLSPGAAGRARLAIPAPTPGLWRVTDGQRVAIAWAGVANPLEVADLRASASALEPSVAATGGGLVWLDQGIPDVRRVQPGRDTEGTGWIGLQRNRDFVVTGVSELPLLPAGAALVLLLGAVVGAWRREGR